jgi:hypothetical protein
MPAIQAAFSSSSEADIAVVDVVEREGGNLPFIRPGLNGEVVPEPEIGRCGVEGKSFSDAAAQ